MLATNAVFRLSKIVMVGALAVMASIIVIGNTTDYYTNFVFVEHVLKMDTTFSTSNIHYRQINNPVIFHCFYVAIILAEAAMAYCCGRGCYAMAKQFKTNGAAFHKAKGWAVMGITIGLLIWFMGFEVIGGEWFAMWQSSAWNGLGSAERITTFLMAALIFLQYKEED